MIDKELLRRERQLSDADLQEVIGRAARLQREATDNRHAAVNVTDVADELDIAPEYVDQALSAWERDREAAARAAAAAQVRRARYRKVALGAALGLSLLTLAGAWSQGRSMRTAGQALASAEARLQGALTRQADLIPQLVALSGGDTRELMARAQAFRDATTPEKRIEAARAFDDAATVALGRLPAASDPASEQRRLSLQHEIAGARNRISVERTRYEAARGVHETAHRGLFAAVARVLSFAN